ncbi:MAG: rhodanese-like domain-containing protein [Candidatus Neomarinimicrobiota bacterium]|nr:rhodanese-like domain-containing protein [Candidatus Neomarinimicrobiota bacterium]
MIEISVFALKEKMDTKEDFILLDVREKKELDICTLKFARHIPMEYIPNILPELDKHVPIVVMCHTGGRSLVVCRYLVRQGYNAVNLVGGIDAWAKEIDPRLTQY